MEPSPQATDVEYDSDIVCISARGLPGSRRSVGSVFANVAAESVNVDIINLNTRPDASWDLAFTVAPEDAGRAVAAVEALVASRAIEEVQHRGGLGKISLVGTGMRDAAGYAHRMFRALADAGINIEMIATSDIRIACVVRNDQVPHAVAAVRRAFLLDQ